MRERTSGTSVRQIALTLILSLPLLASCMPTNINTKVDLQKVLALKNMVKTLYEKYSSELLGLRSTSPFQVLLKEQMLSYMKIIKKFIDKGDEYQLADKNFLAILHYIVAFDYLNDIQTLISFAKVPTLTDYAKKLSNIESFMRANIFNLYLSGTYGKSCVNETRVLYVKVRPLYEATKSEIVKVIENMPATFTASLASKAIEIVHKADVLLTLNYLNYLLHGLHDSLKLNGTAPCPPGYGSAPWLRYACAYAYKPLPPTPCNSAYSFVLRSVGLKEIANSLCGVKK